MKAIPGIPKAMIIYSFLVVTLIFVLGGYMEASFSSRSRYRREAAVDRYRVPREIPFSDTNRPCETVHVAFVAEDVASAILLVKSILIYRHSSLHLHIFSHPFAQGILEDFLSSWKLPYFNHTFYSYQSVKEKLMWIPGVKINEMEAFVKLLLPSVIPKDVKKIIAVDSNVTFLSDIRELYDFFWDMEVDYYLFASVGQQNDVVVTPAVKATEVLLMDLVAMRDAHWFHLWHRVIYEGINHKQYSFSLESILNSITQFYPNSHMAIPCSWGVHYETRSNCGDLNTTYINIVHWDSVPGPEERFYKEALMQKMSSYDGKLLRSKPWICHPPRVSRIRKSAKISSQGTVGLPKRSRREMCRILKKESEQEYRTHRYFYGTVYEPSSDFETTLVTQLSLDRLDKFSLLLEHWDGPISIAMYGTDAQAWNLTKFITVEKGIKRKNLAIHVVYRQGKFYPVNHLRNVALNAVTTPYVFLNDGDFLPSYGLFDYLKSANKLLMSDSKKRALVIPAFDGLPGFVYPESKADLLDKINNNTIREFCVWCAHRTHGQTNFSVWAESLYPYKVEWAYHFEPYVVVRRDVVRYDERFVGYGWNKVSQITELKAQGYEFVVIPDGFLIHSPHKRSKDREVWKRKNYKFCINTLWKRFVQDLSRKYGADCLHEEKAPPIIIKIPIT